MSRRVGLIGSAFAALLAAVTVLAQNSVVEVQLGSPTAPKSESAAPAAPEAETTAPAAGPAEVAVAVFGGGCFWCMEKPYDQTPGVLSTTSGYTGGSGQSPTYEQVSSGRSGHVEVVEVRYDPSRVNYAQLLNIFWRNVDPLAVNRQFCDGGPQYRSVIFAADEAQRALAVASVAELQKSFSQPIATEVLSLEMFWPAEDYHQDYYQKNPIRYSYYRSRCGRDARLEELWGKPEGGR